MSIDGIGTATYLYVNNLAVTEEIQLNENAILMPVQCKLPLDIISNLVKNDIDYAVVILNAESIASQMKITDNNPKDLAIKAWNAQWELFLLSAIFNFDTGCNLQCTHPVESITEASLLTLTNYHMRGLFRDRYIFKKEDKEWLKAYYPNAQSLLENDSFQNAIHSMTTYRWHSLPRVQLAILWADLFLILIVN